MPARSAPLVSVPDVVGLPFHVGRDAAARAGVALANPDPDGSPIGALAWPGAFVIVGQQPAAGTLVRQWDSLAVQVVRDEAGTDPSSAVAPPPATGPQPPIARVAEADERR